MILQGATSLADLGEMFGADLTAAELRYLAHHEWARTAADVVWRRSKLGLRLSQSDIIRVDEALANLAKELASA
jgi:glycerol-3-phosphate dehydrogenase